MQSLIFKNNESQLESTVKKKWRVSKAKFRL